MKFDFLIENLLNKKTFVIVSGLHGDEPAGNIAAQFFTNKKNVHVISNINCTNKRRMNGKDLNRHFDTPDENDLQDKILLKIEEMNPSIVISLHNILWPVNWWIVILFKLAILEIFKLE